MTTAAELIRRGAKAHPDRIAVTFEGEHASYAETYAAALRITAGLRAAGIARGDRAAVLLDNGPHSVAVDFALTLAGVERVPLNSRLSVGEHEAMLRQTGCRALLVGADLAERGTALAERTGVKGLPVGTGSSDDLTTAAQISEDDLPAVEADDPLLTLFTSGTTGTLKAARHTQGSYAAICRNVLANLFSPEPDDAMLHAASLVHASGVFVLPCWLRGARTVVMRSFDPAAYLDTLGREGITAINLVPTMLGMLMRHEGFAGADVGCLRRVIYGASPMPRPLIEAAMDAWGRERFWQYYGQTELPLCIAVLRPEHHVDDRLGTCGQVATDVELKLVDEDGRTPLANGPGEIVVRGPSGMSGYHDADELNAETMLPGGWIRTRDVGVFDENGFLRLLDRTSDMIVTGGYNVYPREVEDALSAHPAVAEACVVGTPDETWVEAVTAVIVLHPGAAEDGEELSRFVAGRLASHKKPRRVHFQEALPRTAVGKLDRKAVRRSLAEEDGPET